MVKTKLRYYTYKVTFKDLPCYFYYGKHKDNGKPYLGSPKTWRHLWDQFEPEIQILQWYETAKDVEEAERSLIKSTWKQTWNGKRYSLNRNIGGYIDEETLSNAGKKGITKVPREAKVRGAKKVGSENKLLKRGIFADGASSMGGKETNRRGHGFSNKQNASECGKRGGISSRDLKRGLFDPSHLGIGGKTCFEKGTGLWAPENLGKGARTTNKKKFVCLVTGKVTTSGPLTIFQKARGIDPSLRKEFIEDQK